MAAFCSYCPVESYYHFFLCSSIETPPGPSETTINNPPITERVYQNTIISSSCSTSVICSIIFTWKKSYFKKSLIALYEGRFHQALQQKFNTVSQTTKIKADSLVLQPTVTKIINADPTTFCTICKTNFSSIMNRGLL